MATQPAVSAKEAQQIAQQALNEANKASESVRLDAWRSVFEKTNRILSGRALRIRIVADPDSEGMLEVPGWSDGETINFNGPMVKDMLRSKDAMGAVLRLKGLNYHELSHVLFTPRQSDELPRRILEKAAIEGSSWWWAFNALEDQRIETWFTSSYGPSRRYFEAAVLQWLITDGNAEAAVLTYGRKYLPAKIRVQAERVFVKKYSQDLMNRFKAVIDEYLTVVLPTDSVRGFMVVSRYKALLDEMQKLSNAGLPKLPVEDNGVAQGTPQKGSSTTTKAGRVSVKEAKDAAAQAKKATEQAAKDDAQAKADMDAQRAADKAGDGQDKGSGDAPSQGQGNQPADGAAQGNGSGQGGGQGQADGQPGQQGGDAQDGQGNGAGSSGTGTHEVLDDASLAESIRDMMDAVHDGMDEVREDAEVQKDVSRVLDAVKAVVNNGKQDAAGEIFHNRGTAPPEPEHLVAQRRVRTLITQIRQAVEPQILHRQMSGRIDVRRVISRRPTEMDVFKSYDEGAEDETGMEAVILVDISGSMGSRMTEASGALWILKRAFDSLGIRCTVLGFDTQHVIIYQPGQKAAPRISVFTSRGGTDPTTALQQANLILSKSHQPSKVLVTITDGAWSGTESQIRGLMRNMHLNGVSSMLLGLDGAMRSYGKHDHQIGHDLSSISEMPKAVSKLVGQIMQAKTSQHV